MRKRVRYKTKIGTELIFEGGSIILFGTTREHAEYVLDLPPSVKYHHERGKEGKPDRIYLTTTPEVDSLKS